MIKRVWALAGIVLISLLVGGLAFAESNIELSEGETLESKREISEDRVEIFFERGGNTYFRVYRKSGEDWTPESEERVEIHEKGLSGDNKAEKSAELEVLVKNYLRNHDYDLESLPKSVDYSNSEYLPPVQKQNGNSCVGWAVGYYLRTFQEGKEHGWDIMDGNSIDKNRVFSPYFIYNQINGSTDNGATLQDAGKLLKCVGAATIGDFEEPRGFDVKPSYDVVRKGYKYRIADFYKLFSRNDDSKMKINSLKEYLLTGDLPVIGIDAGHSWEKPHLNDRGEYIVTMDDSYIGGHAVVVVGYDDELLTPDGIGAFKVLNSWGTEWGDGGYAYVSYEAMATDTINGVVYTDLKRFYVDSYHEPYIYGYSGGTFRPDRFITRGETAKMILSAGDEEIYSGESFKDVDENHWAKDYIYTAFSVGYVSGYPDGSFRPDNPITRAEFASIIYTSMGKSIPKGGDYIITKYFYDSLGQWSTRSVNILGTMGLLGGYPDGSFRPDSYVTRAEAVAILNRVKERVPDRETIEKESETYYYDITVDGSRHWAYYDILEASKGHVFKYELDGNRELKEKWKESE